MEMTIDKGRILDTKGRTLILRGCNLGGDSKFPCSPEGASWQENSLQETQNQSFIGRPFPLAEADEHFSRLSRWGFTFLRFIITWEALEHMGPGIYDEEYLSYIRKILKKAEEYGISVFIDPHQDVWSRWTGGDGAPAWTLEAIGMDISLLTDTGAALTQQAMGASYPRMVWPTNYNRYAAATLFSLFFAGNEYAPQTLIEGQSAQDYLQGQYIAAFRHAYRRLKDCKAIVGWGTMNEPHQGFIGYSDLRLLENYPIAQGPMPSPFQAMSAASGYSVDVPVYTTGLSGEQIRGTKTFNTDSKKLFKEGYSCPWKKEGVWTDEGGTPKLLRAQHFTEFQGRKALFVDDFLKPFMKKYAAEMQNYKSATLIFIEGIPHGDNPSWDSSDGTNCVNAFHWYDGSTLFSKTFRSWISVRSDNRKLVLGSKRVAASFTEQLKNNVQWAQEKMGGMPSLLGEFGLPFDLHNKKAYSDGDYSKHAQALSLYYDAIDANLLHSTIWNYTASNTHERGDGWNDEDLSIWSLSGHTDGDPDSGARGMRAWRRPYPLATAGIPLVFNWNGKKGQLRFTYRADPAISEATELYIPQGALGLDPIITVLDAQGKERADIEPRLDHDAQRLYIEAQAYAGELTLLVQGT
ncbi:cellulase family glycosylhydrolase [Treponema sp.]